MRVIKNNLVYDTDTARLVKDAGDLGALYFKKSGEFFFHVWGKIVPTTPTEAETWCRANQTPEEFSAFWETIEMRLKKLRAILGLSLAGFSDLTGIGLPTLTKWELNKSTPMTGVIDIIEYAVLHEYDARKNKPGV